MTRQGVEIMLAVDVSNSMLAQDFEPSRLERTKCLRSTAWPKNCTRTVSG
ncbi:MAG: hypothetical protein ACLR8Y_08120 [Alistipes indistinctus]